MNINQAKNYIKNDVSLYLSKDEWGEYRIPVVRQRPIFLLGAPGIGKTAIMEQVASELGIALVSYSMTHHTRQSALGLPFIKHEEYEGMEYDVSEYTMSEIIASIYSVMRDSGVKEGILFLDEINCVSETLAPSMLLFLQYKVFGKHKVPDGWVIVTAGNPPEYNKSVREFDVVTMDRLKVLEVEADYDTWKKYARENNIRSEITSFLELHKDYFYHMEMTVKGRSYVTARGWEDLSTMLGLYSEKNLPVDETLVGQYIRNDKIVKEFTAYYDLFNKYKKDYRLEDILSGNPPESAFARGSKAGFDERLSVLGMLMDKMLAEVRDVMETSDYLTELIRLLRLLKESIAKENAEDSSYVVGYLEKLSEGQKKKKEQLARANSLSLQDKDKYRRLISFISVSIKHLVEKGNDRMTANDAFSVVRSSFDDEVAEMKESVAIVKKRMHNLFDYVSKAFEEGNEMLLLVTELTVNENSARFIAQFGLEDYTRASETLMISERQDSIKQEIMELDI